MILEEIKKEFPIGCYINITRDLMYQKWWTKKPIKVVGYVRNSSNNWTVDTDYDTGLGTNFLTHMLKRNIKKERNEKLDTLKIK